MVYEVITRSEADILTLTKMYSKGFDKEYTTTFEILLKGGKGCTTYNSYSEIPTTLKSDEIEFVFMEGFVNIRPMDVLIKGKHVVVMTADDSETLDEFCSVVRFHKMEDK